MALDGLFLHFIKTEVEEKALGARVEKIAQPSRDIIIIHMRGRGGTHKLLLCGGAQGPRLHFTGHSPENPKTPPMFCMLLRKHLSGAKLSGVRQIGLDRILHLDFEATNELGDPAGVTIAVEIMGRHSNVIVMDGERKILDSIRRVDFNTSRVRQILPGMRYFLPPAQEKRNILNIAPSEIVAGLRQGMDTELSKALLENLEGFSALICREAAIYAARGREVTTAALTDEEAERLCFFLGNIAGVLRQCKPAPTIILEPGGRPRDFCWMDVRQYGAAMITRGYENCSALLDAFFYERDRSERLRQRSSDLLTLLASASGRITRKLALQREELLQCADRELLKQKGDLIGANLYAIQKGDTRAIVQNFYDQSGGELAIELDARLTPVQNAQRYYTLYRKADAAEKHLVRLIAQGEDELVYLDSVFDALTRSDGEAGLDAIRRELSESGYLRGSPAGRKTAREQKLPALRYRSGDGFTILCGRNNTQNDRLTTKEAAKQDVWLHTQKIPGAHVIVVSEGREIPASTIEQAAVVAAFHSKGRESSKVPVDFTQIRNVRKPPGARPGMVIYDNYRTILARPDEELVNSLEDILFNA